MLCDRFGNTIAINIQNLQCKFNNLVFNIVDSIKYLGVIITGVFNWGIVKKYSTAMQTLRMLK